MKPIVAVLILGLVLSSYAADSSATSEKPNATRWSPPPFPSSPPAMGPTQYFELPPPRYPYPEKRDGVYGEVLLEIVVGEDHHLSRWRVLRATTPGYEKAVLATLSKKGRVPGVPAGVYLYSVVFNGNDQEYDKSRPGTFWIGTDSFGGR